MVMEELKILINSVFNSKGIRDAQTALKQMTAIKNTGFGGLNAFSAISGVSKQSAELVKVNSHLEQFGLKAHKNKQYLTELNGNTKASTKSLKELSTSIAKGDWDTFRNKMKFDDAGEGINTLGKSVKNTMSSFGKFPLDDVWKKLELTLPKNQVGIQLANASLKKYGLELNKAGTGIQEFGNENSVSMEKLKKLNEGIKRGELDVFGKGVLKSKDAMKKLGLATDDFRNVFKMEYLSIMFFSMQLARSIQQMATKALQSYMKLTEGTTSASQSMMVLNAAWETMKFSVGELIAEALEPFIPLILEIITGILNFIDQNEGLAKVIVGVVLAIGLIAKIGFAISQWMLFQTSIMYLIDKRAAMKGIADGIEGIGTKAGTAGGKLSGLIGGLDKLATYASIAIGIYFTYTGIKDFLGSLKSGDIKDHIKATLEAALGLGSLAYGVARVAGVGAVGAGGIAGLVLMAVITVMNYIQMFYQIAKTSKNLNKEEIQSAWKKTIGDIWGIENGKIQILGDNSIFIPLLIKILLIPAYQMKNVKAEDIKNQIESQKENLASTSDLDFAINMWTRAQTTGMLPEEFAENYANSYKLIKEAGLSASYGFGEYEKALQSSMKATLDSSEPLKSFNDLIRENAGTMTEFITATDDTKIKSLGDALETFVKRIDKMNISALWMLSGAITTISDTLSGGGNIANGLLQATQKVGEALAGKGGLQEKAQGFSDLLVDTFIGNVQASVNVLDKDATAANNAAIAQERYNRAKQGATGA